MDIGRRVYTRYFSQDVAFALAGILFFGLSFTPIARVYVQYAVNQDLVFTFRYLAVLVPVLGFRGNYPLPKIIHMILAVFLGIIPTIYMWLSALLLALVTPVMGFMVYVGADLDMDYIGRILEGLIFFALTTSVTVGTWLLIIRGVFAQYRYPFNVDAQSRFVAVSILLFLFGSIGAHRFFVGRIVSGILYLMTMGCLGIGVIVDGIVLMLGQFKDADGNTI